MQNEDAVDAHVLHLRELPKAAILPYQRKSLRKQLSYQTCVLSCAAESHGQLYERFCTVSSNVSVRLELHGESAESSWTFRH